MTDDLIRRGYVYDVVRNSISMSDALDAIDALPASEAFTSLTEKNQSLALDHLAALGQAAEQIEALTADNARLREVLKDIVAGCGASYPPSHGAIKYSALYALTGKKPSHE